MTIIQSIILGIVQGITEFLPVSSSAHLNLFPWIFNWSQIPDSFDVALHFGSLLAIVIYFFKDWLELIKGGYTFAVKKDKNTKGKIFWYLFFSTIVSAGIYFVLDKIFGDKLKQPLIIAGALIVMGIVLYVADKKGKNDTNMEKMTLKQGMLIGLAQVLAFIPGMSRSGSTMTMGRLLGVDRETTAKYSFYLATPIILAATVYKFKDFVFNTQFLVGVVASFITALIVIKAFMKFIKKGEYKYFAIYRILFGLLIIGLYLFKL